MATKKNNLNLKIFIIFSLIIFIYSSIGYAQNWTSLPPYNTLWPLWSSILSPLDPVTNLPTPLVSDLSRTTVLPVQPVLTWDPSMPNPWLLYNSPTGLLYYDPLFGINAWPPNSLIDTATGNPLLIALPSGYRSLPPTDPIWLSNTIPIANTAYQLAYPPFASPVIPPVLIPLPPALVDVVGTVAVAVPPQPPALSELLTPLDILGTTIL
ncbi:MAG: hypothetical protein ACMUJM_10880 [bacterium]